MKHTLQGLKDFSQRYRDAWRASWNLRDQLDPPARSGEELAFLPAHLELTDTPLTSAPKLAIRLIVAFFGIALLWAAFGHLDIVAVAGGKTVSGGRTKVIQPMETAVVKSIRVKDGQHVKVGELLIELDTTGANADFRKADSSLSTAKLAAARYIALLNSLDNGQLPKLGKVEGVEEQHNLAEETLAVGQYRTYLAKRDALTSTLAQREAELSTTRQLVNKLAGTSKIAAARAGDFKNLLEQNFVSKHAWLDKEQLRIEQESDLAAQQSRLKEIKAALNNQRQVLTALTADFRREALDQLRQANEQIAQYGEEAKKTDQRQALLHLKAPVAGTVQQLAVHTVGGVVTPAQPLLAVVPDNEALEVEAMVENKDIGFVKAGQDVAVKIESFPYTRYGYLNGTVESVSHDALQDEKRGLIYQARIKIDKAHLVIDGTKVKLTAGMTVSAEIKTGKRRVMDYFLSPLQEYVGVGLRER
jgi:hemolysin D